MDDVFSERQTGAPGPSGPPQQYPPQHAAPHQHRGQIGYNNPQYNSRSGGGRSNDSMSVASQSHRSNAGGPNNNNPFNDGRRGSQNLRSVPAPANASNNAGNRDTSKGHEKDKQVYFLFFFVCFWFGLFCFLFCCAMWCCLLCLCGDAFFVFRFILYFWVGVQAKHGLAHFQTKN